MKNLCLRANGFKDAGAAAEAVLEAPDFTKGFSVAATAGAAALVIFGVTD